MTNSHTFHIPVLGIGFTIDSPIKVSQYGINSVISLVDDMLIEKIRKTYCDKYKMKYEEITEKIEDFRAKRITSYLNLVNEITETKIEELKNATIEKKNDIKEYFNLLPDSSTIKEEFKNLTSKHFNLKEIGGWLKENLTAGSIDVNIMTKLDKENYLNNEELPAKYNDAHAALRGFANSDLSSSIVFSAGMSPRVYAYMEEFEDFYPKEDGTIKKKIVIKVSDYRSALIQGKFLAKKGLWVSEYRVESGLNCGGHAFATDGHLLGPILNEFKKNKNELVSQVKEVLYYALKTKNRAIPKTELQIKITAQGGVGTAEEHDFLLNHYHVDSVGWGTPFLLVPEATSIDESTIQQLADAKENDLYLSDISPLGVPFNSLRGNTKDIEKLERVKAGKPGSACPKRILVSSKEYTKKRICTASKQYQRIKIKELDSLNLNAEQYKKSYDKIVDKSCICVGLGVSALKVHNISTKIEGDAISVCPGPNMAYFSSKMTLKEMISHIYGKHNIMTRTDRPNMFVNELKIYIEYLRKNFEETKGEMTKKQEKYLLKFSENLTNGLNYYYEMFNDLKDKFEDTKSKILADLDKNRILLAQLSHEIENI